MGWKRRRALKGRQSSLGLAERRKWDQEHLLYSQDSGKEKEVGLRGVNSHQNSKIEEVILRGVKTPQDEGGGIRSWVSGEPSFLRLVGLRRRGVSGAPTFLWIM
jgi:hypothetical protein